MGLPVRRFGSTGWELTTIGLGTWALGGADWAFGWGPQDDNESIATIHHAVEGVIVYSPIHSGLLSGTFDPSRLAPGDWRLGEPDFTTDLPANLGAALARRHRGHRRGSGPSPRRP